MWVWVVMVREASLLVTLGLVVCGREAARKAAATPMRTSTRKLETPFLSYRLKRAGDVEGSCRGQGCSQKRAVLVLTGGGDVRNRASWLQV